MKELKLKGKYGEGKYTKVSDQDFAFAKGLSLYVNSGYVKTYHKGRHWKLHQLLVGSNQDHINQDKLDNRRENLRPANITQQNANKAYGRNKTGYIGVYRDKSSKESYKANISVKGKMVHLGSFKKAKHAAIIRDLWAVYLFGEFAHTNFPIVSGTGAKS